MNPLARSIAVTLWSLAFAWADTEAITFSLFDLNVQPLVPTPSSHVVIKGLVAPPFNQTDHCVTLTALLPHERVSRQVQIPWDTVQADAPDYFLINLGALPEGRYNIEVSESECSPPPYYENDLNFTVAPNTGPVTVVEYFNASLGHYFITADAHEISLLDSGQISGWARTGETFHALPVDTMPSSAAPVCRYYGLPSAGLDTHFFTDNAAECAAVRKRWPDNWILETWGAFGVQRMYQDEYYRRKDSLPYCDDLQLPLYRLYNNRADANHRYTTSTAIRDEMIAKGWVSEGRYLGPDGTFSMCVLP